MCASVSSSRSSGRRRASPADERGHHVRSFIRFSAAARSAAGKGHRRRAAGALGLDHGGGVVDPLLHEPRPQMRAGPCWCGRIRRPAETARCEPNVSTKTLMPMRHSAFRSAGGLATSAFQRGVGFDDHPLEQREQDRVFGREVEVERRAGKAGALGQVVDRDVGERALLEQLVRRWSGWPARGRRRTGAQSDAPWRRGWS